MALYSFRKRPCIAAIILGTLVIFLLLYFFFEPENLDSEVSCSDKASVNFIKNLCRRYFQGEITGEVCAPLCSRNEIVYEKCLGHERTNHVIEAKWNGQLVVLKSKRSIENTARTHFDHFITKMQVSLMKDFVYLLNLSISVGYFDNKYSPDLPLLEEIAKSCDREKDGLLDYHDALYCWNLVDSHDYIVPLLLRGNPAVPKLFGFCGHLFVHEYVSSRPLLSPSFKKEMRSWQLRARLAIALIEMAEALEHTRYSRLYMCDVKEQNFGIVEEKQAGKMVLRAKPVDFDMTWFESSMRAELRFEQPSPCSDPYDCSIIHCLAGCDQDSMMCSKEIIFSNNLQVICRRLFLSRHPFHSGLLDNPPPSIQQEMSLLVKQCAFPEQPTPRIPISLAQQLKHLLRTSQKLTSTVNVVNT